MRKKIKSVVSILLVCGMALGAAACGQTATDAPTAPNSATPATAAPATAAPETEVPETVAPETPADGKAEYAVILKVLSSQFWQTMKEGVEAEAAKQGIKVDIFAANTEDDVEGQVALLENCISKGYKAIAVAPISADNLNNAISEATKKGIYVINIDEKVNVEGLRGLGGAVSSFISTDNVAVGRMGAQYIVDQIGGAGQVAIIEGKAGAASGESRRDGAKEAFTKDGIQLVESQPGDWDRTKAYDVATNYINKYPELKGIYACNDTMAMGALEAVKNSGKNILVVGTDGNDDAIESVKAGELAATVAQDPATIGAKGVQVMIDALSSGKAIDVSADPVIEAIDAILITK